jgi:uncharacterized repeat protein (TIGR01451 family)
MASGAVVCLAVPGARTSASTALPAPQLSLTKAVDKRHAVIGDIVRYTITVGNTGAIAATSVTVDDVLGGDAGYSVNDGTNRTVNSFTGTPVITIAKLVIGHYRWSYPTVSPGDRDIVSFTAVVRSPSIALSKSNRVVTLTNTASSPAVPPVTVTTTAPYGAGVRGLSTNTPPTGGSLNLVVAVFLLLGGLGLILLSMLTRRAQELAGR